MDRRGMKYDKITPEQRRQIYELKQQWLTVAEIHIITGVKPKTIQSINSPEKKPPYQEFERVVSSYIIDFLEQMTNLESLKKERKQKTLKQIIKKQVLEQCGENSRFKKQIPNGRVGTEMRRIVKRLEKSIKEIIQMNNQENLIQESVSIKENAMFNPQEIDYIPIENLREENIMESQNFDMNQNELLYNPTLKYFESPQKDSEDLIVFDLENYCYYQSNTNEEFHQQSEQLSEQFYSIEK